MATTSSSTNLRAPLLSSVKLFTSHPPQTIFLSKSLSFPPKPNAQIRKISKNKLSAIADSFKWRTKVSFFQGFLTKEKDVKTLKEELFNAIAPLDRGAEATPEDQERVDERPKFLRPNGKIYQAINLDTLRAENMETWPFFIRVTASLLPLNSRRVAVKFDFFRIAALILIASPGSGHGQLEISYLDEELR